MQDLRQSLKEMICEALHLEDVTPDQIEDDAPLFGDGLGLDSVDALELAIEIEKRHGVRISKDEKDRVAFSSVSGMATFIMERRRSAGNSPE